MGHRIVKRVPMDFNWPLNETWPGYLSPAWRPCPSEDCDNGEILTAAWLGKITHLILMLGDYHADARSPGHPWLESLALRPPALPRKNAEELSGGLAGRPPGPSGHGDLSEGWTLVAKANGTATDFVYPFRLGERSSPHFVSYVAEKTDAGFADACALTALLRAISGEAIVS